MKLSISVLLFIGLSSLLLAQKSGNHKRSIINVVNHDGHQIPDVTKGSWVSEIDNDKVFLTLQNIGSKNKSYFQIGGLFPRTDLAESINSGTNQYEINRVTGKLILVGDWTKGSEMGTYEFIPSDDFISFLESKGMNDINSLHMLKLFMGDCSEQFVNELKALYGDLELKELGKLSFLGVDMPYIKSIRSEGYQNMDLKMMTKFYIHDVTPEYINLLRKAGYDHVKPNMLKKFVIHDVSVDYIEALNDLGFRNLEHNEIKKLAVHEVSIDFIEDIMNTGVESRGIRDFIKCKIHDVDARFIEKAIQKGQTGDLRDMVKYKIHL